ncbi:hypothetical protein GJ496_007705 [Pomphorhynchus laevis]|nr:hypothetical protein GJ496_007705 [Pomphorhynchus laevis]
MKLIGPIEVDENRIARFLRLTDNNVEETAKLLKEDIKWREEIKHIILESNDLDRFHEAAEVLEDRDLNGNRVGLLRPRLHKKLKTKTEKELFRKFTIQMVENLTQGTEQYSLIVDLRDIPMNNFDLYSIIMQINICKSHYADLFSTCLVLKPFWLFHYAFKIVRHLLTSSVVERIYLINNESELEKFIDRKILPSDVSFSICQE